MKCLLLAVFTTTCLFSQAQYVFSDIATGLPYPVSMDMDPSGNYYVALKGGTGWVTNANAKINIYDATGTEIGTVWDFTDSVETYFERGVLGVCVDPNFSSNNYVYAFYNHESPAKIRVVRFEISGTSGTNPLIILDIDDPYTAGNHTGGNIHMHDSEPNSIYITIGDRATGVNAQDLSNPFGKILRINTDGSIPTNNPFYDDGDPLSGNDDRIYAYGLRNSFDFTFSPVNDSIYSSENGQNSQDEFNLTSRGHNYGWPDCEGVLDYDGSCSTPGLVAPLDVFGSVGSGLPALTGIIHYEGSYMSEFQNDILIGTYTDATVRHMHMGNPPFYNVVDSSSTLFAGEFSGIVDLMQAPDGCILALDGGFTNNGSIVKICPDNSSVSKYETLEFSLYPNPANQFLNVDVDGRIKSITIYDLSGREIIKTSKKQLVIGVLECGIYVLSVIHENGTLGSKPFAKSE